MSLRKIRILPDQYVFKQNEKGDTAFLVISGGLIAELDSKKIGKIETGEIFGELSLILGENRSCSVKAVVPTEIIVIKKRALEEILLSSNLELHKVIQAISKELAKKNDHKLPISYEGLVKLVEESPTVIRALSLQLHHRLTERIY
ncbi:MAG: cyclic nucleotide-binding domain-containing protein [Alphaproteobacteria bacterium]|tara:strand:+ start:32 stop:469 length:438 start_codon:yes stop_codon:yes gene_type:complete